MTFHSLTIAPGYSDFAHRKVAHLKRAGLVSAGKTGFGQNGGACPDWLRSEQEAEAKRHEKRANRPVGVQPDIEWFQPAHSDVAA